MRLALLASFVAAALVTPLAACGGDDDGGITDPGTWLDTYVGRLCTKAHECKAEYTPPQGETFDDNWGATVVACKAMFLTPEQVRASVTAGKVTFDSAAGGQCLSMLGYDTQTCAVFWASSDPAVCRTVYTGTVPASGDCANSLECSTGLSCVQGKCTAPSVAGPGAGVAQLRAALDGF